MKHWSITTSACGVFILLSGASTLLSAERKTPEVLAVERVLPSVGNIHTEKTANPQNTVFGSEKGRKVNGMGTAIVVDERGYMVTNNHVIADVDTIRVDFQDHSSYIAKKIKVDPVHDLALIKIDAGKPLKVMPTGISSDLMLCEKVIAIGNAFGYKNTITVGYISALGRDVDANDTQSYRNLIQTDAAINPGNSGGPLINVNGELIGINVAIRQGAQKIGFVIPIDDARKIIKDLMSVENLDRTTHGIIGRDIKQPDSRMLLVDNIVPDSPAALAGLRTGDVIVRSGAHDVSDGVDLERSLLHRTVGERVDLMVRRGDRLEKMILAMAPYIGGRSNLRSDTVAQVVRSQSPSPGPEDRFWNQLGLKLVPLTDDQKGLVPSKYNGGMKVVAVKENGVTASQGIAKGDILVGMEKWETVTYDNIAWILNQPMPVSPEGAVSIKFVTVRGQEVKTVHASVPTTQRTALVPN